MARIKDTSVEAVRQSADFVAVVEERTPLRKAGARLVGRCPFHEERTPSFSVNPVEKLYYCFGCHKGGDMIAFVRETQGLDFVGAVEWLAERFRASRSSTRRPRRATTTERQPPRAPARAPRGRGVVLRALPLGLARRARCARDYLAGRGLGEEVCREFRLGLALGGTTLTRKALEKGFTRRGAPRGRADARRAAATTSSAGSSSRSPTRAAACSASRRGGSTTTIRCRRSTSTRPSPSCSRRGRSSTGSTRRARRSRARTGRCIVEGNTDVIALRQAGFEPVVACMGTALTEQQLRELGRLTKRLWLAFDGDAAGESAALRGMELAVGQRLRRQGRRAARRGRPGRRSRRLRGEARRSHAVRRSTAPRSRRERADDARRGAAPSRRSSRRVPDSLDRRAAWRWANDHLRDADSDPRRRHRERGRRPLAPRRRGRATGSSAARSPGSIAHRGLDLRARGDHARALPRRDEPRASRVSGRRRPAEGGVLGAPRRARRLGARRRASTRRPPRSSCCGCASASSGTSCARRARADDGASRGPFTDPAGDRRSGRADDDAGLSRRRRARER